MKLLHVSIDGPGCNTPIPCISLPQLIKNIEETNEAPYNLCPECRKKVIRFLQEKEKNIERMMQENSNKNTSHFEKSIERCSKIIEILEQENHF